MKEQRLYRLYTIKHGEIAGETEFHARDDSEALARLSRFRKSVITELWDLSSSPIRLVE